MVELMNALETFFQSPSWKSRLNEYDTDRALTNDTMGLGLA